MAGRGPAPKAPEQRRNHHAPQRGEWTDLPAEITRAVLPNLPSRGKGQGTWSARTRAAWKSWRADPVTSQYGPADVQLAIDLAWLYEQWVRDPTASLAGEIRQRQDALGLTPKGRQDRRWRMQPPADVVDLEPERQERAATRRRLRAVDPAAATA